MDDTHSPEPSHTEKDPVSVIQDPQSLEVYLDEMFRLEGLTFESWVAMFGQGFYRSRNEQILTLLTPLRPRRIFEFACAGGYLAELLLSNLATIELYVCSNFSPRMLAHAAAQLNGLANCEVRLVDANVNRSPDMQAASVSGFDTFITTSFEHIQFDRELIEQFPRGASFVFSVALFDDPEHFRVFSSEAQLRARYSDLLEITAVVQNPEANKAIVAGHVR